MQKEKDTAASSNVYQLVDAFYQRKSHISVSIPQDMVERFLRHMAWSGRSGEELCSLWQMLAVLISYLEEQDVFYLDSLGVYDHLEILYRLSEQSDRFSLSEEDAAHYFTLVREFYKDWLAYRGEEDEGYGEILAAAEESLYVKDVFLMPPRHTSEDFYSALDSEEVIPASGLDELDMVLDSLLQRIGTYFKDERYVHDFERAFSLYTGPGKHDDSDDWDILNVHHEEFWQGFWDYFLLDYHLIETDEVPLFVYFFAERQNLTVSEQDIIRDLLHSAFKVFYVTGVDDDFVLGHDLFTDETFEIPSADWLMTDFEHMIYFGHMHPHSVMMLNYVACLPASRNLQVRMKDILERELGFFRCQMPEATLADFLSRESAAVRHILFIMSSFAQLNLLTHLSLKKRNDVPAEISKRFSEAIERLTLLAKKLGFSRYASALLANLFQDYLALAEMKIAPYEISAIATACIITFGNLNGLCFDDVPNIETILNAPASRVSHHMRGIKERLGCTMFDVRYLMEEGFVFSLYYE